MSYRKRGDYEDSFYSEQSANRPTLAYDNYAVYDASFIPAHSLRNKLSHFGSSQSSYRLKGSDSGSYRSLHRRPGCKRCLTITVVIMCMAVIGAVIGVAVYFSDQNPVMKTTTPLPTSTTPTVPVVFSGTLKLAKTFSPELADPNSSEYQALASAIEQELDSSFRSSELGSTYSNSRVAKFASGSIVVQFRSYFNHSTVLLTDSNGNRQPTQISIAIFTDVIVNEVRNKKTTAPNSNLAKVEENSLSVAEGTDMPTTTIAVTTTTVPTTTTTSTVQTTTTLKTTDQETTQVSTTTTAVQTTQADTTTTAPQTSTAATEKAPTTTIVSETTATEKAPASSTTTQNTATSDSTTGQSATGTEPSKIASTLMTTIPTTTTTTTVYTTTTQLQTTTEAPAPPVFVGEVKLNQTWDDNLNDTSSPEYQNLATDIEAELDATFKNSSLGDNYNYSKVTGFKPGSIEVDYISFFIEATVTIADNNGNTTTKISMNASVVVQVFREQVQKRQEEPDEGGSKRSIFSSIIKESIKVIQLPPPTRPPTVAPTRPLTTVPPVHPCDNNTYMETVGSVCAIPMMKRFTDAKDLPEFCLITTELIECVNQKVSTDKGTRCSESQADGVIRYFGPGLKQTLSLAFDPTQCLELGRNASTISPYMTTVPPSPVKRVAFTIKTSGFTWDDSLLNPKSTYFQSLNITIVSNFTKAFGDVPGFLHLTVTSLRKGSIYADMTFTYDGSKLSGSDAMHAVHMAVQNGAVHLLQVDNYFLYRGEPKDGECPLVRNTTAGTCPEECQMDSNCTGSAKCCFNGCGHTCQQPGYKDLTTTRPWVTTLPPTVDGVVTFSLKFLNMDWRMELLNDTSDYFTMMERSIMGNVTAHFGNVSGVSQMKILGFRNGSIIVDFWIRVTWPLTSGGLIEKIKEMLGQGGRIHQMQVDPGYFPHDTVVKDGFCPRVYSVAAGSCNVEECIGDSHCKDHHKCCSNGCVRTCVDWREYSTCKNVTFVKETITRDCVGAFNAFMNGLYEDDCSMYRDVILCTTANLQVKQFSCTMEGIANLVGRNIRAIFGDSKNHFDGLSCFDGVTNVPKYDVRNFCREVELYKYHAKYSCAVNLTEHRNSSKELCSLYHYKVICADANNKDLKMFGNCNFGDTKAIIGSNRSVILPELDSLINDTACAAQSPCQTYLYSDPSIASRCLVSYLGYAMQNPQSRCLALEAVHDCLVSESLRKNIICSADDVSDSSRLYLSFWSQSYANTMNTTRLRKDELATCTTTKQLTDPDLVNTTCQKPNMLVLLATPCLEYLKRTSNLCTSFHLASMHCMENAVKEVLNKTCTKQHFINALRMKNDTVTSIVGADISKCLDTEPSNETCFSFETFEKPEYQKCFEAYYALTYYANTTSKEEKCRLYEHSLGCVEKSIPYCDAQEVHNLINAYVEIAGEKGSSFDQQCPDPGPSRSFCDDEEAHLLYIYGRCSHYLAITQRSCIYAPYFMECAYNHTRALYFRCPKTSVITTILNATAFYERRYPGYGRKISTCLSQTIETNCTLGLHLLSQQKVQECLGIYYLLSLSNGSIPLSEGTQCYIYQSVVHCVKNNLPQCTLQDYDSVLRPVLVELYNQTIPRTCQVSPVLRPGCTIESVIIDNANIHCKTALGYLQPSCSSASVGRYLQCIMGAMWGSSYYCTEEQVRSVMANATSYFEKVYPGEGQNVSTCIEKYQVLTTISPPSVLVKRVAFTIKTSGFTWDDSLLNSRSTYFQYLNNTIVGNFTKAFGDVPGFLQLTVTSFMKGSIYADMTFTYDSSKLSGSDSMQAVSMAVQNGTVYQLQVDKYFLYRGEPKDGECPLVRNTTAGTCPEECQMDSNCTGSAKCCFNGCGHTCQHPGLGVHPCEDFDYLEKTGAQCSIHHVQNLTSSPDIQTFCRDMKEFLECLMDIIFKEKRVRCSDDQIATAMTRFGLTMKTTDCYKDLTTTRPWVTTLPPAVVKRVAFTIKTSGFTWDDSLLNPKSTYFQSLNITIVSNFTKAFGNVPGFLHLTVTSLRKGSIYADLTFTYDSSKLSGSDAMHAVYMAVQNGTVHQLQVNNYFLYRGEPKDGECPLVRNTTAGTCPEECQMDSNCTGSAKCCFNGCGHTCQQLAVNCEDLRYMDKIGSGCVEPLFGRFKNATDLQEFCHTSTDMIDCINREVFEDIGKICSDAQIEMAIRHFGPGMEKDYELRFSLTQCLEMGSNRTTTYPYLTSVSPPTTFVKRISFTIKMSGFTWEDSLLNSRSTYFQYLNSTIVSNFTKAFGDAPGFLQLTVTSFTKGSIYADLTFTYDSSKLSGSDAMHAVYMAVQNGTVHQLQVNNYFLYRGEPKDGECPLVRNTTAGTCPEECQMDSNCTGSAKCCFNGCGHTCQQLAVNCEDLRYMDKIGSGCVEPLFGRFKNATDLQEFCHTSTDMIDCINREVFEDIGKICSDAQIEMAIRHFGPGMEKDYELRFSLTQCLEMGSNRTTTYPYLTSVSPPTTFVKRISFTIKMSGFTWEDSLLNSRSTYFQYLNSTIVSNFTKAFGDAPGFLQLTVTSFTKGSIYADLTFTYDSSKLSGSDAMHAVYMAVQNGTVHQLQVNNYFLYRGEPKDGECPLVRNTTAGTCPEECQMDSNCTGSAKCCFNGCGHTCQQLAVNCEDLRYMDKIGSGCVEPLFGRFKNATDLQEFCHTSTDMIDCINREVFEDIGKICSDAQIEMAIRHFGPGMEKDYELRFSLTQCLEMGSNRTTTYPYLTSVSPPTTFVKRISFTIKMSGFTWEDSLLNSRSAYFQYLNSTIVSNFTKAFGDVPGFLYLTVTSLRNGSIYADLTFTYDSSKLSGSDAMHAVYMAVQNGTIYQLQVEKYFLYRGEIKDGECPRVENSTVGICVKECQMDNNCTGSTKCCFNGCGHTCQQPQQPGLVVHPCEDYDYLQKTGEQCSHFYAQNLTSASDIQTFCRIMKKFSECSMDIVLKEKRVRCSDDQIATAMTRFGLTMKATMNLRFDPADCYPNSDTTKSAAFTIRLAFLNWSESLSDPRSDYFQMMNRTIISNFTAAFGHHPGYLGLILTRFRKGSVYVDLEFKYDSSKLQISDAMAAVQNATTMGMIHSLPVDKYFMFRGELKEGTCPIPQSNSTGICIEECQMDANCTEARKCCFNGCGHSCQNTEERKRSSCEDLEFIQTVGERCSPMYHTNLTTAGDIRFFCSVMDEFTKCTLDMITKGTGVQCTSDQISTAIEKLGPRMKTDMNLTFNPTDCYKDSDKSAVKSAVFSIRLVFFNWSEALSDPRSTYFQEMNQTIVSNFTAAFKEHPGFLGLSVTRFRKGSVYVDLEFKYDSSKLHIRDAMAAVQNATTMGMIHSLPVDNYFMFRGELKDGTCPAPPRNNTGVCEEKCQMDVNCTGTQRCCFNGCGHICQDIVDTKANPCDDMTYLEKAGEECLRVHQSNLTTASDVHAFCSTMRDFTKCSVDSIAKATGIRCSTDQIATAVKILGPRLKADLNLTYIPEDCFKELYTTTASARTTTSIP